MHVPSADVLPPAVQYILISSASLAVFVGTLFSYIKKKVPTPHGEVAVVSATFADKRTIERLTEAIDDLRATQRRVAEAVEDGSEATRANTDAMVNLLAFIKRNRLND